MSENEDGEVFRAAYRSIGKGNTLVSRRSIENRILDHPDEYPLLSKASRISRRRAISRAMNGRFPPWSQGHGVNQTTFVWILCDTPDEISDQTEQTAAGRGYA